MSGPTKAGEPSMEEILASIRKIIADDPNKSSGETSSASSGSAKPASGPVLSPGPSGLSLGEALRNSASAPLSAPASEPQRSGPSFGRLSEALRTTFATNPPSQGSGSFAETRFGQSAPSSPLSAPERGMTLDPPAPVFGAATDRARSIDSELDDILDEPLRPATTPSVNNPVDNQSSSQWAVWRSPSGKSGDGDTAVPAATSGTAAGSAPLTTSPSLGRPSGGFYPSSGGSYSPAATLPSSTSSSFGKAGRFEPTLPGGEAETSSGLGSLVPKRDDDAGKAAAPPAMARSPRFEPNLGSESTRTAIAPESKLEPAKPATVVIAAMPPVPAQAQTPPPAAPMPDTGSAAPDARADAVGGTSGVNVPLPPRTTLFSRPFAATKVEAAPAPAAPVAAPAAIPPADRSRLAFGSVKPVEAPEAGVSAPRSPTLPLAAAQVAASASALDALAAGFAASNAQVTPTATQPATAAPPVQTVGSVDAVTQTGPAQLGAAPAAGQPPRTLEDMVADMVKPMLQKWLTDNMPRIIEKALRSEAGQPGGGGPKLPGT